jgi:hypothetical protein
MVSAYPTDTYVEVRKQGRRSDASGALIGGERVSCTADGGDVMRPCVYKGIEKHPLELEQHTTEKNIDVVQHSATVQYRSSGLTHTGFQGADLQSRHAKPVCSGR